MTALEQSMKDIIAAHGLICFEITATDYDWREPDERIGFSVSGQWRDPSKPHGRGIASGGGDTIAEAMANFATVMAEKRGSALADEALPEIAA